MARTRISWQGIDRTEFEELELDTAPDGTHRVRSWVRGPAQRPFAANYELEIDAQWRVRRVLVELAGSHTPLELESDGAGKWTRHGKRLRDLDGAIDVDISVSPFTNTLPIRRLGLEPGRVHAISTAFVHVPESEVERDEQRYERLDDTTVRYASADRSFQRDLTVDADGFVVDYPGLFRRA
jgi:uncharacterized protein